MKICSNCQSENQDGTNFCIKCGAALPEATAANTQKPAKKSFLSSKAFLAVVALILVGFIINATIAAANPSGRLLKGLESLGKMDAFTVTSIITAEYEGDDEDFELMNDASLKTSYAVNLDKMLMEVSADLMYDNKSIAEFVAGMGEKNLYVDLRKLYDKKFSYTLDRDVRDNLSELQVLLKYIRQTDIKFDRKKYAGVIADVLDDDMKGSLGKVTLTMDGKLLIETLVEVLEEMADDEALMKSIRKNAEEVINKILKDKHEFENLFYEEDLEDILDYIEDEDEFEMAYQAFIEGALYRLESIQEELRYYPGFLAQIPEFDITISFGMFQDIKDIKVTMVVENPNDDDENITFTIDSRIKGAASFTKVNTKNAVDIEDLMYDEDELVEIGEEVFENLADKIKKNKKLSNAIEDLTGVDVDDFADLFLENMFY